MIGVVLAGGASSRFAGKPKGLEPLQGRAMALRVADILAAHCDRMLIEAPRGTGYEALGLPLIHAAPEHAGKGPLAAIAAGLALASEGERVAFAPCDMPLLTAAIYEVLIRAGGIGAYARTPLGVEPLVTVMSKDVLLPVLSVLGSDAIPRTHIVLDTAGAQPIDFADARPFANVNTAEDLARVNAALRG